MSSGATSVTTGELNGWQTLSLANDLIEIVALPGKGANIYSIIDRSSGIDVVFKTPWGLAPPLSEPREGSDGNAFLENYEGGWQALLPNTNDPCTVDGIDYPFHGEVAAVPWSASFGEDRAQRSAFIEMSVDCRLVPLRLVRTLRCRDGKAELVLDEQVSNLGDHPVTFVWGHHLVLGAPLVGAGAQLSLSGRTLVTPGEVWEDTARLEPGQRSAWPLARLRAGGQVDLSQIPGPEAGSHDDVYVTDLVPGPVRLWNPTLDLGFELDFDVAVYKWLISWQPYGGANTLPLAGSYGLGLEPWVAGGNLEYAIETGQALTLEGGASISTQLTASLLHSDRPQPPAAGDGQQR